MNTPTKQGGLLKPALMLVLGLAMIGGAYVLATKSSRDAEALRQQQEAEMKQRRAAFLASEVPKLLDEEEKRNLAAERRARKLLDEIFRAYEARVPEFVEEMTRFGMKVELAKAAVKDWWSGSNEARNLATGLFEEKVVSDAKLKADLIRVVSQFASDLAASRNQIVSDLTNRVSTLAVPTAAGTYDPSKVAAEFEQKLQLLIEQRAVQAPAITLLSFGGGLVVQEATQALVTSLLRGLAARLGTLAVARGGAVAAGAGAGALAGPVGIAAGLAIGLAIDVLMEKQFREKLTRECTAILAEMKLAVQGQQREEFTRLISTTRELHEVALKTIIVGGNP